MAGPLRPARPRAGRWSAAPGTLLILVALAGCAGGAPTAAPFTPGPTLDSGKVASALTRFEELIQNPSLTMHLEQTTSLVIAGASRTISGVFNYRMDRSGGDYAATVFFPRVGRTVELRGVAGIDYAREGSSGWVTVPVDPAIASELGNPWQCLGPLDKLQPLNRITNPREAFIFGNSGPIEYLTAELRAQGFEGHITSLRFVVRPDGIPIEVTFNGEASAPGGTVTFASTLTASRVGEDITIDQPVP